MIRKNKRKNKQRSFGLQTASEYNRTKFNKRFSWERSPSTRISLSDISIIRGGGAGEKRDGETPSQWAEPKLKDWTDFFLSANLTPWSSTLYSKTQCLRNFLESYCFATGKLINPLCALAYHTNEQQSGFIHMHCLLLTKVCSMC